MAITGSPMSPGATGGGTRGAGGLGTVDYGNTGASFRSTRTSKDESSLMLRLMMKEREQVLPEDKLFYQEVSEYIDKLQLDVSKHKQGRVDAEERERLSTCGFVDREMRYSKEIRNLEESLQRTIADKENLQREISLLT